MLGRLDTHLPQYLQHDRVNRSTCSGVYPSRFDMNHLLETKLSKAPLDKRCDHGRPADVGGTDNQQLPCILLASSLGEKQTLTLLALCH